MARKTHAPHVVIALYTGFSSNRDILAGILRYAAEHGNWSTDILQLPMDSNWIIDTVQNFKNSDIDGIITTAFDDKTIMGLVRKPGTKSVVIRPDDFDPGDSPAETNLYADFNRGIGELGARYLLSRGLFNSFGFIRTLAQPKPSMAFAESRERGFRAVLSSAGKTCRSPQDPDFSTLKAAWSRRLDLWLQSLPKPAAVMCFCDQLASRVLQACLRLKFSVPNQVSILGVDNDTLLCENIKPSISSIDPNHQQLGYQAARLLDASLGDRRIRKPQFVFDENQVIERESTKSLTPSALLIRRGLAFIADHATENIGVDAVVKYLGVSRRLAFQRFREIEGKPIRQVIEDIRLQKAARLLKHTRWAAKRIAGACGYPCQQTFFTAFRKRFGVTPSTYRENQRTNKAFAKKHTKSTLRLASSTICAVRQNNGH